jgi:hypothetical protein
MVRRTSDSDSFVGDDIDISGSARKAMARFDAEIHSMMSISDIKCLGKFPWPGAQSAFVLNFTPPFHQLDSAKRFRRANQDETVDLAFDKHVQHPVRAVTKIDIGGAGSVSFDERARGRTRKCVAGFVVLRQICLGFDNCSGAFSPDQLRSHKFAGASDRIASEKSCPNDSDFHLPPQSAVSSRLKAKRA